MVYTPRSAESLDQQYEAIFELPLFFLLRLKLEEVDKEK